MTSSDICEQLDSPYNCLGCGKWKHRPANGERQAVQAQSMCRRRNYLVQVGTSGDGDYRDSATGVMVVWAQYLVRQVY